MCTWLDFDVVPGLTMQCGHMGERAFDLARTIYSGILAHRRSQNITTHNDSALHRLDDQRWVGIKIHTAALKLSLGLPRRGSLPG